jgi:PKHD-type hydroxylase
LVNQFYYPLFKNEIQPVLTVENLFSEEEMDKLLDQLSKITATAAIVGSEKPISEKHYEEIRIKTHEIRKSNVSFLEDAEFDWLYDKLIVAVNHVNTTNYHKHLYGIEPLQYTEYDSEYSGFYGPHVDDVDSINGLKRTLSFTMQLSEGYSGGELLVYHNGNTITGDKTKGSITFFDSSLVHEVKPLTSGFRKSLVGWVLGPRV